MRVEFGEDSVETEGDDNAVLSDETMLEMGIFKVKRIFDRVDQNDEVFMVFKSVQCKKCFLDTIVCAETR